MRIARCSLSGVSRYSQSKYIDTTQKGRDESHADFEKRIWRTRCHTDTDGNVYIPPMQFKKSLATAAKYKGEKIPGKGKSQYTKHFLSGVLVADTLPLDVHVDKIDGEWLLLSPPSQSGAVQKCMPYVDSWSGIAEFLVLDDIIPEDVFERTLIDSGSFIGIGRFRPAVGGFYGRFQVDGIDWEQMK